MCFLGQTIAFKSGKTSIDQNIKDALTSAFGGFVKPLQGFNITIENKNASIAFLNQSIKIPTSYLYELAQVKK